MESSSYLIVPLLQGFYWFDEGLQSYLRKRGWSDITRPQSMVMVNVISGVTRPSDIARMLGVSRQAIHVTIGQMVKMDLLELKDDPNDLRSKIVAISKRGKRTRKDARRAVRMLTEELGRRIGERNVRNLIQAFAKDWGAPVDFTKK